MRNIKSNTLFLIFLYLNVFCKGIGLGNDDKIYLVLMLLGFCVLFIKIIIDKYTKKELFALVIILAIGGCTFLVTKKPTLLLSCICISGMKNVDLKKVFISMLKIRFITFILVISLALLGIVENTSITMWRNGQLDIRYSLGFGHPNTLHLSLFILLSLYIYNRYEKLKLLDYIFVIISNIFIYSYSESRTGFLLVFALIILTFLSKNKYIKNMIIKAPKYVYIGLLTVSFITAMLYNKLPIMNNLNEILNGRIAYSNYYLNTYGFSLFGTNISTDTNALFDNGYIFMFIQYGIIGLILMTNWIFLICNKIRTDKNVKRGILVLSYLLYIFTESFTPNIFMNIILLFVADSIFHDNKNIKEEKGMIAYG